MWDLYIHSQAFDKDCAACAREIGKGPLSDNSDAENCDDSDPWETSSTSSIDEPSPYHLSKLEAQLYYFGLRGPRRWGPKLIFRTSKDVFKAPSGPAQDARLMRLLPVYEHPKLGKGDLWATIRSKVCEF